MEVQLSAFSRQVVLGRGGVDQEDGGQKGGEVPPSPRTVPDAQCPQRACFFLSCSAPKLTMINFLLLIDILLNIHPSIITSQQNLLCVSFTEEAPHALISY